ncbi:hypothetical protein BDD12DRAFT_753239 [Trichophaea hybrida]|nr:hypothetical protein BDD12DRAFT_753239 [Trichophaea hybrida]
MITVPLEGIFYWKLVFDYHNTNNAGSITHSYRCKTIERFCCTTFLEKSQESLSREQRQRLDLNFEIGSAFKIFSANVDYQYEEINHFLSTTVRAQEDTNRETISELERKCVGPQSKLSLYQRYFVAPGITIACDVHSTIKQPDQQVRIDVMMQPVEFVSGIKVVYGDSEFEKPYDCLKDLHGGSSDINAGFGGKYVWLVPEWTKVARDACTSFDVIIRDDGHPSSPPDLAKGAGGKFRFLYPVKDVRNAEKVVAMALLRSSNGGGSLDQAKGYSRLSEDLNRHRGEGFLHVVYKVSKFNVI